MDVSGILLLVGLVFHSLAPKGVFGANLTDADNLMTNIFNGYNKDLLPRYDQVIDVSAMYFIFSLGGFDEKAGILTSVGGVYITWYDPRLSWDPASYGNLSLISIPASKTWYPDVYVINPADEMEEVGGSNFMTWVHPNGKVGRSLGNIFKTSCTVDITYFPFDTQVCKIIFSPWGYYVSQLRLTVFQKKVDMKYYTKSAEWDLVKSEMAEYALADVDGMVAVELTLKLYCRYLYTRPCMINHIWGLKQL